MKVLDLFACAGGATTGLAMLGAHVVGIDHDPDACATHLAAGHPTIRADLTAPVPVCGPFDMVWASPPCTAFSMAGKGAGREVSDVLVGRILAENWAPMDGHDPTVWLVSPTMAALLELRPTAIAMENVPPTLPVMHACAQVLERHGWHTAVGVLSAERFGVAQTRKRAFLIANRERRVQMPEPTHQGYGDEVDEAQGSLFGSTLERWVSMADALGWGAVRRPSPTLHAGKTGDGRVYGSDTHGSAVALQSERAVGAWVKRERSGDRSEEGFDPHGMPCQTITEKARSWEVWPHERPSTTLVSSFRPDIVAGPGYRQAGDGPRQDAPGSIRVTEAEAARLQAFPNGHPWRGSRTSVFRQVGNAVPPPVAAAVAGAALGVDWCRAVADYLTELYSEPLEREVAA